MRNAGANILPVDLQQAAPEVSPLPSETSILCVTSDGYLLISHNQNSTPYGICLDCYSQFPPAWKTQIHKENHFLQFTRGIVNYRCQSCDIVIEKTRSPYSCKSCRDTLVRTINQLKTSEYDWGDFPSTARIVSELGK